MSWSVDGVEWEYPCTIQRVAEVQASDISGLMLNKTYFNDVIGTYLKYTVSIAVPKGKEDDYTTIYELLSAPVNHHTFVLPYNEGDITINGRMQVISDQYVRLSNDKQTWRKTTFDIIANTPSKTVNGALIQNYGLTPYPDTPSAQVGDFYEYTTGGWIQRDYADGNDTLY